MGRSTNKDIGYVKYNIVMNTPIGLRYGTINLFQINNSINVKIAGIVIPESEGET